MMKPWRSMAAALLISMALHAIVVGRSSCTPTRASTLLVPARQGLLSSATAAVEAEHLRRGVGVRRQELVRKAREDLARGELRLGRFLLEAQRLDAIEQGVDYPEAIARERYDGRLAALRSALERADLEDAVPEVFGDLRYHGRPGGRMADALARGGGSCEQIAALVAVAAWDGGARNVTLRFWGGASADGVAHVAPIARRGGRDHDLMTGTPALKGGVTLRPEELIEVYARAHEAGPGGRSSASAGPESASTTRGEQDGQPSLIGGFPANSDVYPGRLPLFSMRAVHGRSAPMAGAADEAGESPLQDARRCGYFVRMVTLSPLTIHAKGEDGAMIPIEPHRVPLPERLDNEAALLRHASQIAADASSSLGDRLMALACVVALGESAAVDFALTAEPGLGAVAMARAREAAARGRELTARWAALSPSERSRVRQEFAEHAGRTWLLLRLDGGQAVLEDLVEHARPESWGKVSALAGLLVHDATRARALELIERYPLNDQVDVMHEAYHAHDHMAPWGSDFDLEPPAGTVRGEVFLRAWRVYRGLAWRIWIGRRPVDEMLAALHAGLEESGLDRSWEVAFLEYTARNLLGLLALRQQGIEPVRALRLAAERTGHPAAASLIRRLSYVEAQGELTATTLADAWHLK